MIKHARSPHVPAMRQMRSVAMQAAARSRDPLRRSVYVAMAREVNRVLVQSDQRRKVHAAELRAVLESLT